MQIRTNQSQRHNPNPRFKKILSLTLVFALSISIVNLAIFIPSIGAQTVHFTDLKGHWAEATIYALVKEGVVEGFPDGTFRPNDPVQVDQFIKMILMALSEEKENGERYWRDDFLDQTDSYIKDKLIRRPSDFDFNNSKNGYWAQSYLDQATYMTILNVNNRRWINKDFTRKLTREDIAYLAISTTRLFEEKEEFNYVNLAKSKIKDLYQVQYDEEDILQSYMKGIMSGYPDGTFGVNQLVTRAEAAAILRRIVDASKRNPYKPDLSGLPHAIVPTEFGKNKTIVFFSWEMKKAFDNLENNRNKSDGYTTMVSGRFGYYKDEEIFKKENAQIDSVSTMFSPLLYDMMIITNEGADNYTFNIRKDEGILERHKESLLPFLEQLFDKDVEKFLLKVEQVILEIRDGSFLRESYQINNRNVNFSISGDHNYLYMYIPQKNS